jgi:hypothetical protein
MRQYPLFSFTNSILCWCDRHVIVGRNFGSYVTHETKHFIYFYLGQVAVLLFKRYVLSTVLVFAESSNIPGIY